MATLELLKTEDSKDVRMEKNGVSETQLKVILIGYGDWDVGKG